jgi:hypothetical protein
MVFEVRRFFCPGTEPVTARSLSLSVGSGRSVGRSVVSCVAGDSYSCEAYSQPDVLMDVCSQSCNATDEAIMAKVRNVRNAGDGGAIGPPRTEPNGGGGAGAGRRHALRARATQGATGGGRMREDGATGIEQTQKAGRRPRLLVGWEGTRADGARDRW